MKNTPYKTGHIVVTEMLSDDVVLIGRILKIVVRDGSVFFLVSNHEAARTRFRYFESVPLERISLVLHSSLGDYKPLVAMSSGSYFKFLLHHHIPVKHVE